MTLSGCMDAPLTELMRAAVLLSGYPELRAAQERIVMAAQALDAVRVTMKGVEDVVQHRRAHSGLSAPIVNLDAFRASRGDGAVRP